MNLLNLQKNQPSFQNLPNEILELILIKLLFLEKNSEMKSFIALALTSKYFLKAVYHFFDRALKELPLLKSESTQDKDFQVIKENFKIIKKLFLLRLDHIHFNRLYYHPAVSHEIDHLKNLIATYSTDEENKKYQLNFRVKELLEQIKNDSTNKFRLQVILQDPDLAPLLNAATLLKLTKIRSLALSIFKEPQFEQRILDLASKVSKKVFEILCKITEKFEEIVILLFHRTIFHDIIPIDRLVDIVCKHHPKIIPSLLENKNLAGTILKEKSLEKLKLTQEGHDAQENKRLNSRIDSI